MLHTPNIGLLNPKMEAVRFSETSATIYLFTRCTISEGRNFRLGQLLKFSDYHHRHFTFYTGFFKYSYTIQDFDMNT
jgi:hypothetical protein